MPQTLLPPQSLPATPDVSPHLLHTMAWLAVPCIEAWGMAIQVAYRLFLIYCHA
jgi:hypothetical protein